MYNVTYIDESVYIFYTFYGLDTLILNRESYWSSACRKQFLYCCHDRVLFFKFTSGLKDIKEKQIPITLVLHIFYSRNEYYVLLK